MEFQLLALPEADEDAGEAGVWATRLLAELSDVDDAQIEAVAHGAPAGSKGVGAATGALLARLTNPDALRALVRAAHAWATRTGRSVKVKIGDDELVLGNPTREQMDRVVEAWVIRHTPGA